MKVHGEFKMQAHQISSVVVDIAAFKVCHSVGIDKDATALRAARARSSSTSIGAMEEMSQKVQNVSSHPTPLRTHKAHGQFSGALEELSGKVRKASTHSLSSKIHEHARSTAATVSSRGQWMKCHGRFKMQALTACDAKITSTRTANSQFKGAMDEMSQKVQKASTHVPMPRSRTRLS